MGKRQQGFGPAEPIVTLERWRAPDGTYWDCELTWVDLDGRAECVAIKVTAAAHERPVTAQRLRQVPVGRFVEEHRRALRDEGGDPARWTEEARRYFAPFASQSRR